MDDNTLLDFAEDDAAAVPAAAKKTTGGYAGATAAGFKDFLLKPELLRAIQECGFERPSDVQQECIPQAILGQDVLCQAKSGMGKTAVFVIATLQQLKPVDGEVSVVVLCHTHELAHQIQREYVRFAKFMEPAVVVSAFFGGVPEKLNIDSIKKSAPHVVIGTPGRVASLVRDGHLKLGKVKHFVLDECDKMLEETDIRSTVQQVFKATPYSKQVMMFSATLSKEIRPTCKKFMQNPVEVLIDDDTKLTLHGMQQHYAKLKEEEKNKRLFNLLDTLEFNQVVVFVKGVQRCDMLARLLREHLFPASALHGGLNQKERMKRYTAFKEGESRILVATDMFGRGLDVERVNIVVNYDMPEGSDAYLHRVARAGRFGTKGLAVTFVSSDDDAAVLNQVQERFLVNITELPADLKGDQYLAKD